MTAPIAKLIETHRHEAEVYHGDIMCKEKIPKIFREFSLPENLIRVEGIQELGFNRSTGFLWILTKKSQEHKFKKIGQTCVYATEITMFIEKGHVAKITGVRVKKLLISVGIADILVGDPSPDMLKFTSGVGLSESHPISAFQFENEKSG